MTMTQGPHTQQAFAELADRLAAINTHVGYMIRDATSCMSDGLPPTQEDIRELHQLQRDLVDLAKSLGGYVMEFDQAVHFDNRTTETT